MRHRVQYGPTYFGNLPDDPQTAGVRVRRRRRPAASRSAGARAARFLLLAGLVVLLGGAAADLAYHTLPAGVVALLEPVTGPDGGRAHLVTVVGMVATLLGVLWRGWQ